MAIVGGSVTRYVVLAVVVITLVLLMQCLFGGKANARQYEPFVKNFNNAMRATLSGGSGEFQTARVEDPVTGPTSRSEKRARAIIERYMRAPFPSCHPKWLRNPKTNRPLQLDCYNEKLRLALEFDGSQHAFFNPRFHRTVDDWTNAVERDNVKDMLCKKQGVSLIRVPFWTSEPDMDMSRYIFSELVHHGYLELDGTVNDAMTASRVRARSQFGGGSMAEFVPRVFQL